MGKLFIFFSSAFIRFARKNDIELRSLTKIKTKKQFFF